MKMYKRCCLVAALLLIVSGILLIWNSGIGSQILEFIPFVPSDSEENTPSVEEEVFFEDDYFQVIELQGRGKGFYADEDGQIFLSLQIKELARLITDSTKSNTPKHC